ncbi:MAG: hypothetical protein QMD14_05690 [Candidatus Aenigmarchaeota archaeon]|nr:hypothetical protein [Candidatus Aenigmarchaeota archaeon]
MKLVFEKYLWEMIEPVVDSIALARTEISKYPKDALKVHVEGDNVRYELFGCYNVWAYILDKGFSDYRYEHCRWKKWLRTGSLSIAIIRVIYFKNENGKELSA